MTHMQWQVLHTQHHGQLLSCKLNKITIKNLPKFLPISKQTADQIRMSPFKNIFNWNINSKTAIILIVFFFFSIKHKSSFVKRTFENKKKETKEKTIRTQLPEKNCNQLGACKKVKYMKSYNCNRGQLKS